MEKADSLIKNIGSNILTPLAEVMIALAVVFFLYGVVEFIAGAGSGEKRTTGRKHMIWGIIGLFVMISVFGLMNLLAAFWEGIK